MWKRCSRCWKSLQNKRGGDWRSFAIRYIGIDFTGPMIQKIREHTIAHPDATRGALTRFVCWDFGFYSPGGNARISTFSDILKRMDMDNLIRLPKLKSNRAGRKKVAPKQPVLVEQEIRTWDHRNLEPLMFVLIKEPAQQRLWNDMMSHYHYLKRPRLFGPQLRYLIYGANSKGHLERSETKDGILLGAISFSPAAWRLVGRDAFIGWDDQQREKQLNRVIGNSRFLILPWVQCPNLASMVLGRITKRVAADWKVVYGVEPVLLETFVQQNRFSGACYRAANWIEVGSTGGYSYFSSQKKKRAPKFIFLYPLCKRFREELCHTS
ncbi:conserved hypothetical protein [delta proteobacterium NaphS2]|nr:conserved hypothetical protein [delta proteobacterium NaphS2]